MLRKTIVGPLVQIKRQEDTRVMQWENIIKEK